MSVDSTETKGPLAEYRRRIQSEAVQPDSAQAAIIDRMQTLWTKLDKAPGLVERLRERWLPSEPVRGLYLWGGVGRGKTWLMDLFYDSLTAARKERIHFHRFMIRVHQRMAELNDVEDPLTIVGREMADRTRVLCFDEFFVSDIGDAMILGKLLDALFERGVTLIATSNVEPAQLYKDGLQRARFLPAIALLERHTEVIHLNTSTDYRLRILQRAQTYHWPLDQAARENLEQSFAAIATTAVQAGEFLRINSRDIEIVRRARGVAWFTFSALCETARSAADYIEVARRFNTVLIEGVPQLSDQDSNAVRRFINLIDEFYDRNVKTMLSAAVSLDTLYAGERLEFEFQRTTSRLIEMQSKEYLSQPHRP